MSVLYPLKFEAFPQYLQFGGQNLMYKMPPEKRMARDRLAEVWDISGHPKHYSVVANGPLKGHNLLDLMRSNGKELFGITYDYIVGDLFPLMVRFLDCQDDLPPAVHPDDEYATKTGIDEKGKTEAWYILESSPGAAVYIGLKPEVKEQKNIEALAIQGNIFDCLNRYPCQVGDVFLIPPGRPHSIGAGNVVYEIQQTSNAIFPFDWLGWNDKDQARRERDLGHAIEMVSLEKGKPDKIKPISLKNGLNKQEMLTVSKFFVLEKFVLQDRERVLLKTPCFNILTSLQGMVHIQTEVGRNTLLTKGETVLIPAVINSFTLVPEEESIVLCAYPPYDFKEIYRMLATSGHSRREILDLGGYGSSNPFSSLTC